MSPKKPKGQRLAGKSSPATVGPHSTQTGPLLGLCSSISSRRIIAALFLVLAVVWQWWSWGDATALGKLRAQLQMMGASVDCAKCAMFEYPGGFQIRGLMTTCGFTPGTRLLSVPAAAVLSDGTIHQKILDLVADEMNASPHDDSGFVSARDVALATGLLHERALKQKSRFAEHIASLPIAAAAPQNLPRWDETQLNALSIIHWEAVLRMRSMLEHVMSIVMPRPALFGRPTEEDCIWALGVIISRQVHGRLFPLLDQANHASQPNSELSCDHTGCQLTATQSGVSGQELTITYGNKPNLHLLLAYGFVMPNNSASALSLDLSALNVTNANCPGPHVMLDHNAPLAVQTATVACFEAAVGRCVLLEALRSNCEQLSRRLSPPKADGQRVSHLSRAMGRPDATTALAALEERRPQLAIDEALAQAVREEMHVVARCIDEAQDKLNDLVATGACSGALT